MSNPTLFLFLSIMVLSFTSPHNEDGFVLRAAPQKGQANLTGCESA